MFNKLTEDMNIIAALDDEPNDVGGLTAAELKARFDLAGNIIKNYLNSLVDALAANAAAGSIGIAPVSGVSGATVQEAIAALEANIEAVSVGTIPDGSVTAAKLAALTITAAKIANLAITAEKIANGAVVGDKIAPTAVGTAKIADYAVTENKLAAASVIESKIGVGAVTADKIGAGAVTAEKMAAGAIGEAQLKTSAVTTDKIMDRTVNGAKLNLQGGDLPWARLTYGTHYFNEGDALPEPEAGRIIFVRRE